MGPAPTTNTVQPHSFSLSEYEPTQPNQYTSRSTYGNFTSYKHKITEQEIDKYVLEFSTKKQQQNYYECYLQRYREEYIVSTIDYVDLSKKQFCSHLYTAQVYIEHIPVRLGDITDIPFPDNLYIFRNCLCGFGLLFDMIGYFQVEEDHICINNYGELKVWLNSDLSKNYPEDYNEQIKSQCDMVHKILVLIEKNTNIEQCPIELSEYFIKKHNKYPNFSEALNLLDQYVHEYKCVMPKYCESIFELFRETDSHEEALSLQNIYQEVTQNGIYGNSRNTIHLQEPEDVVPMLDLQGIAAKEEKQLRGTIKKNSNIYMGGGYRFLEGQEDARTRLVSQKTERLSRVSSHHNSIVQTYNKLETKRAPVKGSIVYQITKQIVKPAVHFTYYSPRSTIMSPSLLAYRPGNIIYCQQNQIPGLVTVFKQSSPIMVKVQSPVLINIAQQHNLQGGLPANSQKNNEVVPNLEEKKDNQTISYYDVETGSEEIDPEIAADLLKYL